MRPASFSPAHQRSIRWSRWGKGCAALLATWAFASCAQHYQLASPSDLRRLPVRRGENGGNVVTVTPWRYCGSHYQTHEFRYYFNRDNALNYRKVSVARDRTVLRFEERRFGDARQWVTLQTNGPTFYFTLLPMHR